MTALNVLFELTDAFASMSLTHRLHLSIVPSGPLFFSTSHSIDSIDLLFLMLNPRALCMYLSISVLSKLSNQIYVPNLAL